MTIFTGQSTSMPVEFLQDFDLKITPSECKRCKSCGLYLNQAPALDTGNKANIFWVGLSAVQFGEDDERQPLSPNTRSGGLIEDIERPLKQDYSFYKTNIVKCLPLNSGKIRYPLEHEMEKCFPNFEDEIERFQPTVIFLLGKQVATFVLKKHGIKSFNLDEMFNYGSIIIENIHFVPVHHPSFILVYKSKHKNNYVQGIRKMIDAYSSPSSEVILLKTA